MSAAGEPGPSGQETYFWSQGRWWRKVGKTSLAIWGSTAFAFVGSAVAARALGPGDYGAVVLAIATASFVTLFLDLTLIDGVVHHGSRAIAAGEQASLRSMLRAAFIVDLAVGVIVAAILIALAGPLADLASGGEIDPSLVRLAALVGLVTTVDSTTGAVLLLARRPDLVGWMMAVTNITRVLAIIAAVNIFTGPAPVIAAYVVAALVGSFSQLVVARRVAWNEWDRAKATVSVRSWMRPLIGFGIHSSLAVTFQSTEKAMVPILLGALASPAAAGLFSVALLPVTLVLNALVPMRLMLLPEQTRLAAKGDVPALRKTVRGMTGAGFALAIPGAIVGWFVLPVLIPALFSSRFDGAVEPARILLGAAVFQFAIGSWSKILPVALGRPRFRSAMTGAYMAVSLGLTAIFASNLESTGAAIATTAAAVSTCVAWWFLAERVLRREAVRAAAERPRQASGEFRAHAEAEELEPPVAGRQVRP